MTSALENLDRMIAEMPPRMHRKLPLAQLCGAYYALERGFNRKMIAKAFGISHSAACQLAQCRQAPEHGTWRYKTVADEYDRLGKEEFARLYYTDAIDAQIARIRMNVPESGDIRQTPGPDILADKWANIPFEVERIDHSAIITLIVEWRDAGDVHPNVDEPLPAGWTYRSLSAPDGHPESLWFYERYRTSSEARKKAIYGYGDLVAK